MENNKQPENKQQRLAKKLTDLTDHWEELGKILAALRKEKAFETRVEEKLRLNEKIEDVKQERDAIEQELEQVEEEFQRCASESNEEPTPPHSSVSTDQPGPSPAVVLQDVSAGGNITVEAHQHYPGASSSPDPETLRESYLNWLCCDARQISLTGIDRRSASPGEEGCQNLDAIYIALLTLGINYQEGEVSEKAERAPLVISQEQQKHQLSALAQLNQHQHLVLLGDPGGGKSTFVNFVAMCLAGAALGEKQSYLNLLASPLPDDAGKDTEERQPWQHGVLLPVRVILRDFAARGFPPDGQSVGPDHVWQFLAKELSTIDPALGDVVQYLKQYFLEHGGLLLLDGLDEVPEAERYRTSIKDVVEKFARIYRYCRVLVTSRTYAYQKQGWRLKDFKEAVLAPFSRGQICRFVDHWYPNVAASYDLTVKQAHDRATQLKHQILNNSALFALAERPLLLTLMASLHAWRLRDLPKKRVELYKETVDLLLDRWERRKFKVQDAPRQPKSLLEWLKTDKEAVLKMLGELAYKAHKNQLEPSGTTADIPEKDLVDGLIAISDEEVRPNLLVKYLRERTGLLIPHGVKVYTFPHRTFQEYLAACCLTEKAVAGLTYPANMAVVARRDPNRWREVVLLSAAKAASGYTSSIWGAVEALCQQDVNSPDVTAEDAWGALLAGQALQESADLKQISSWDQPKLHRVQNWLVAVLTEQVPSSSQFPATERALAGNILAHIGDPRPGVGLRKDGLPDITWCKVPEGSFLMGSDPEQVKLAHAEVENSNYDDALKKILKDWILEEKPQHTVRLSSYQISRYPVTNAQYRAFVEDGGYTEQRQHCWPPDGWKWRKAEKISEPAREGGDFDLPNHPVVHISWYEAMAFCRWLTLQLRESGELTAKQEIRLPTEAEWEKATRGTDGWMYPWGNDAITAEHANYSETQLGVTSAVGCFSRGASLYGCDDMIGNVWEWCMDWYGEKYYENSPKENPPGPASGSDRVIRGGSWGRLAGDCRAAYRDLNSPGARSDIIGFRLLRTPL